MVTINRFALALAALGSGSIISACAAEKSNMHATEIPSAKHADAKASCGAKSGCGAAKQPAMAKSADAHASCGANVGEVALAGSKSDGQMTSANSDPQMGSANPAAATPMKTSSKKMAKKAGAHGGCGQGSCG